MATVPRPSPNPAPERVSLLDPTSPPLEDFLAGLDEPSYRSRQVRSWLFRKHATTFDEMTDLSHKTREALEQRYLLFSSSLEGEVDAPDTTHKALVRLSDGEMIEAVLIREGKRATACISTQVGCPVGCPFCASGLAGTKRNLHSGEIVEQVLLLERILGGRGHLTHVVFMGIGEPLLNFTHLRRALEILHSEAGFGIGARRMTLSTVGPKGKIERLAALDLPVGLAISLHAPNDSLRDRLVPGNSGVRTLVDAASRYRARTGREVTFEYVLLDQVNDRPEHALELRALLGKAPCTVNLIPYNPVPETGFRSPGSREVAEFRRTLEDGGLKVTVRKRKGRAAQAACGQLRWSRLSPTPR